MTISDDDILKAGRILLKARLERGAESAVPSAVSDALDAISVPDDAKRRGPSSPLTDDEVNENLTKLSAANLSASAKVGLAKSVLGMFGLA